MAHAPNPNNTTQGPHRLRRTGVGLVTGLLAIGLLAACSKSSPSPAAATAGSASSSSGTVSTSSAPSGSTSTVGQAMAMIHISSYKYQVPASVAPGQMVSVMNMDQENHTVTADSGNAFDVKAIAGQTVTFTAPTKPGSYPFHCTYHSNMHAVLVVK